MPWTPEDARGHTKAADTPKKQRHWAAAANSRLKACKAEGGSEKDCAASAIKVANAAVKEGAVEGWIEGLDELNAAFLDIHLCGLKSALESERALRKEAEKAAKRNLAKEDIGGDYVPLVEADLSEAATMPVKLIGPGWGASGYYSPSLLQRDGPKVFKSGTKMFWDHATEGEERDRPEGSLRNLAAELMEDAEYQSDHPMGAGLYSSAKIFSPYEEAVKELAPHIGLSINAWGICEEGEAEEKQGKIVTEIGAAKSVDFVTSAGAGGEILRLFESAGRAAWKNDRKGDKEMAELEELKEVKTELEGKLADAEKARIEAETAQVEADAEIARLREAVLLREAWDFVSVKLAECELPELAVTRLIDSLSKNPPIEDGKIDEKAYAESIEEAVKVETEFLAKVMGSGTIRGMGGSGDAGAGEEGHDELKESFKAKFESEGMSPEEAETAAEIAAAGR